MTRLLTGTRFLIVIPIMGLAIAAAFFFVLGGLSLIRLIADYLLAVSGLAHATEAVDPGAVIVEVVEHVHSLLVGTVLYLTAVGLYQLFIGPIPFPAWLQIENTEELETNLIGVTVVVLAVNFMGESFAAEADQMLEYGAGIALPIAALGLFIALRAWAAKSTVPSGGAAGFRAADPHPHAPGQADPTGHASPLPAEQADSRPLGVPGAQEGANGGQGAERLAFPGAQPAAPRQ